VSRLLTGIVLLIALLVAPGPALAAPARSSPLGDALDLLGPLTGLDGTPYPAIIRSLGVSFDFVPLPTILYGGYQHYSRRIVLNGRLLDEDAGVLAAVIVHEVQHARDFDQIANGQITVNCEELEVRAFQAQSGVWRSLWPRDLPTRTPVEQNLTRVAQRYEAEGVDGLRTMVNGTSLYQRTCAPRDAAAG
jgi:hypothetical protein